MSHIENDKYLIEMNDRFEDILFQKRWEDIQPLYKEMEDAGMGQYVPEISHLMSEEDVMEYKHWDEKTNGSVETQMDDSSDNN